MSCPCDIARTVCFENFPEIDKAITAVYLPLASLLVWFWFTPESGVAPKEMRAEHTHTPTSNVCCICCLLPTCRTSTCHCERTTGVCTTGGVCGHSHTTFEWAHSSRLHTVEGGNSCLSWNVQAAAVLQLQGGCCCGSPCDSIIKLGRRPGW